MTTPVLAHPADPLGGPPVLAPAPVDSIRGSVVGRRVLLSNADGYLSDLIAVTDPADDPVIGDRVMVLALEDRWWDWKTDLLNKRATTPRPRDCRTVPSSLVYVERGRLV